MIPSSEQTYQESQNDGIELILLLEKETYQIMKKKIQSLGGQAVSRKLSPARCPRCKQSMEGRVWHSFLGHLGLHGLADKYFEGDLKAAQRRLRRNGLAKQDPFEGNGAWPRYVPVQQPPLFE